MKEGYFVLQAASTRVRHKRTESSRSWKADDAPPFTWICVESSPKVARCPIGKLEADFCDYGRFWCCADAEKTTAASSYGCSLCCSVFVSKEYLRRHQEDKHLSKMRRLQCRFCSYTSNKTNNVKSHERTHTGEKPYVCPVCSSGFALKGTLDKHLRAVHKGC
ncbi:zinc finger protein 233-like [Ornithodoros turicata]|uniref:zinc finger protein 233-like n=1 Tax=Ornithodoros turicata TaxID=34597 RepID=UPI003138CC13